VKWPNDIIGHGPLLQQNRHKADMQLALMKAAVEGRADMFWKCRHFRL